MIQRITQLEERLFEDRQGTYRASIMRQFDAERARLNAYLQQPSCSAEQRRRAFQQYAAIEYAQAVIDAIWNIYHVHAKHIFQ